MERHSGGVGGLGGSRAWVYVMPGGRQMDKLMTIIIVIAIHPKKGHHRGIGRAIEYPYRDSLIPFY